MGHRSHRNEWRTVGGPHALVFLEANQPRQSLVDPGINHGFEPDYGFETGRRARRRPAPEGSQGRGARPRMRGFRPALGRTSGLDMCYAAMGLKPATVLFEGDDPRAYIIDCNIA